ncbi:MAG: hypothetical protein HUK20_15435 [Fibrobacter sp.]|nr:hypothetical protein [Fibrobacter sp.]
MRDKNINKPTLYILVSDPSDPEQVKPDVGCYSPKELAFKENTTTTSVYSWVNNGLPHMRRGEHGNILINYQDYIQWMIECARKDKTNVEIPAWAFRFVKDSTPKRMFKRSDAHHARLPELPSNSCRTDRSIDCRNNPMQLSFLDCL